jgi:hypothetical protein
MPPITGSFGALTARGFGLFSAPAALLGDPFFEYVTMLLPGNGTNGGQNNTFLDSSTNNFTITRNGNTTQGTFSPYGSNWSNYFGGVSGNYLAPQSATSSVAFGTGNFTFECWLNADSTSGNNFVLDARSSGTQNNLCFLIQSGSWLWQYAGSNIISTSSGMITVGTWNHVAFVRNSGTLSLYVNGSLITSVSDSTNYAAAAAAGRPGIAGGGFNTTEIFKGYISNLRIVVGTAVYTSAFTPSTTPLTAISGTSLLTCQSNRFIDNSTNAFTITVNGNTSVQRFSPFSPTASYATATIGGSGYFDGGSDYLRLASGTTGVNGSAFTICLWFYPLNSSVVGLFDSDPNTTGCFRNYTTNTIEDQNNATKVNFANTYQVNAWNWMCITKSGTSFTVRINGTSIGTGNCATNMSENEFTVGAINGGGDGSYLGYISDFQILNTSTVVSPPTAPLTNASGKTLLLNFTNASIIDNAMMNNLETVGNAQISTSVSKFGGGSMAFDGTGDYLDTQSVLAAEFGSGDFTIEFWLNASGGIGTTQTVISKGIAGSAANDIWTIEGSSGGNLTFYAAPSLTPYVATTTQPWTSGWAHIAISRSGSNTRMFVNGVQSGSTYTTLTTFSTGGFIRIGSSTFNATRTMTGYIDDLRITKGYARYTSNFTAPTAAFPTF